MAGNLDPAVKNMKKINKNTRLSAAGTVVGLPHPCMCVCVLCALMFAHFSSMRSSSLALRSHASLFSYHIKSP